MTIPENQGTGMQMDQSKIHFKTMTLYFHKIFHTGQNKGGSGIMSITSNNNYELLSG